MKAFWDARYTAEAYAYGHTPNAFFAKQLSAHEPGRLLLPAEGEGRNAVFAAQRGWDVTAFDFSGSGREKALQLAEREKVSLRYELTDVRSFSYPEAAFEAAALIFAHLPPEDRHFLHQKVWQSLAAGGVLWLEAFSKEQLGRASGGPKKPDMLYHPEALAADFPEAAIQQLEVRETELDEGPFHQGKASVVRLIAKKN